MKISAKISVYTIALILLVVIGVSFQSNNQLNAAPQSTSYTLGPFEAMGVSTNIFTARVNAMADLWNQIYGPGGIVSQLPAGEGVVSIDIIDEEFFSPEYVITFTVTIDELPVVIDETPGGIVGG